MKLVGVIEAPNEMTAAMWSELLRNNGIPAEPKLVGSGNYGGFLLGPLAASECWVMVREEDAERAKDILEPILKKERRPHRGRRE